MSFARGSSIMRLLVVGHSFVTAFAQSKYVAIKKLSPLLQLKIVVPKQVPHPFMTYTCERAVGLEQDEVVPLATIFPFRSNMTYLFWPRQLYAFLQFLLHWRPYNDLPQDNLTLSLLFLPLLS